MQYTTPRDHVLILNDRWPLPVVDDVLWARARELRRTGHTVRVIGLNWRLRPDHEALANMGIELLDFAALPQVDSRPVFPPHASHRDAWSLLDYLRQHPTDRLCVSIDDLRTPLLHAAVVCGTLPCALERIDSGRAAGSLVVPDFDGDLFQQAQVEALQTLPESTPPAPEVPEAEAGSISVVIAHFNQIDLLKLGLDDLERQLHPPLEIIVVDDGSEPAALAACETLVASRKNVRLLAQANGGPSAARNAGAAQAKGTYLLFCDHDNRFRPALLQRLVQAAVLTKADVATCAFASFRDASDPFSDDPGYIFCPISHVPPALSLVGNYLGDSNLMIKREVFTALGGFYSAHRDVREDWELFSRAQQTGYRRVVVPEVLFDYRIAHTSHARNSSDLIGAEHATAHLRAGWPDWLNHFWRAAVARLRDGEQQPTLDFYEARLGEAADKQRALETELRTCYSGRHLEHVAAQARIAQLEQHLRELQGTPTEANVVTARPPAEDRGYGRWAAEFSSCHPARREEVAAQLAALSDSQKPLISVVMPVYNPPLRWLERALESVRDQIYPHWQLCIADDASTFAAVPETLARWARLDDRITFVRRESNGHISAASNSALELVRGDFIALMDQDDEIEPDALAEVVIQLARRPQTDIFYSDEDKIDEQGARSLPYCKPEYLPDLITAQNYFSHLSVFRTALVQRIGGFRVGYEGSQDWDLVLRCIAQTTPDRIVHIPRVLYHWRTIEGSTARNLEAKDYAGDAGRRALVDHFAAQGETVEAVPVAGYHWRVVRPRPDPAPLVTIIIPTHDQPAVLAQCVTSILAKTDYPNFELLLINNRTADPRAQLLLADLKRQPRVEVVDYHAPFNFSAICNFGVARARGDVICLLNNDTEVINADWLTELVTHATRPEIGAVGAMLYFPDDTIQHAGVVLGLGSVAHHAFIHRNKHNDGYHNRGRLIQNYSAVTAACLAIRKAVYQEVGGFDAEHLAIAFNDVDFCLRVREAGYRNLWTPFAELYHHESKTRGREDTPAKEARFTREVTYMRKRWGETLDNDPAYSPNLALSMTGWDLAWPPRLPR